MKKAIAVIPARWQSSRFPGKPMAMLAGKSIIQRVYDNVFETGLFAKVVVATDSEKIYASVKGFGGNVRMTSSEHQSGTDRVAEVCRDEKYDLVVNVQGDEPFISKKPLEGLLSVFEDKSILVASLMHPLLGSIDDHNQVKVVCDKDDYALYFSRSAVPYNRDNSPSVEYFGHVGVYAFTKEVLLEFVKLPPGKLEQIERLEQLRLLENQIRIKMVRTEYAGFGIDTPEDLKRAETEIKKQGSNYPV